MAVKKNDKIKYLGPYDPKVPDSARYPAGTVVGFREHGEVVTVLLDGEGVQYADWPIDQTGPA